MDRASIHVQLPPFLAYSRPSEPGRGWGMHNIVITAIGKDFVSQIPEAANVGYDEPREYLPSEIVRIVDEAFSEGFARCGHEHRQGRVGLGLPQL